MAGDKVRISVGIEWKGLQCDVHMLECGTPRRADRKPRVACGLGRTLIRGAAHQRNNDQCHRSSDDKCDESANVLTHSVCLASFRIIKYKSALSALYLVS